MSHDTRHTLHITHHTSHVTRHHQANTSCATSPAPAGETISAALQQHHHLPITNHLHQSPSPPRMHNHAPINTTTTSAAACCCILTISSLPTPHSLCCCSLNELNQIIDACKTAGVQVSRCVSDTSINRHHLPMCTNIIIIIIIIIIITTTTTPKTSSPHPCSSWTV